jgi:HEAT repeat protein
MSPLSSRILLDLRQGTEPLTAPQIAALSDLSAADVHTLIAAWSDMPTARRLWLVEVMGRMADERFELNFDAVHLAALGDPDPAIRSLAIRNLWENEEPALARRLLEILRTDPAPEPVQAAARALGHFVLMGELAQLDEDRLQEIVAELVRVATTSPDATARRLSVESLGYSSDPEATRLIGAAFDDPADEWRASALVAMGRSANPDWTEQILPMLRHASPTLRREGARACGELEAQGAAAELIELLEDSDAAVRAAAIWALGQVGGKSAYQALTDLSRRKDDMDEAEQAERALENLAFVDGTGQLLLYAQDDDLHDDLDDEVDEE